MTENKTNKTATARPTWTRIKEFWSVSPNYQTLKFCCCVTPVRRRRRAFRRFLFSQIIFRNLPRSFFSPLFVLVSTRMRGRPRPLQCTVRLPDEGHLKRCSILTCMHLSICLVLFSTKMALEPGLGFVKLQPLTILSVGSQRSIVSARFRYRLFCTVSAISYHVPTRSPSYFYALWRSFIFAVTIIRSFRR